MKVRDKDMDHTTSAISTNHHLSLHLERSNLDDAVDILSCLRTGLRPKVVLEELPHKRMVDAKS